MGFQEGDHIDFTVSHWTAINTTVIDILSII